mmetsp:Transcript_79370/g.199385  ORF Transcript_79370/g.199385 Transcript_79370/m.199385 type:complete len:278 (-) Transcript_79370:157-990(-)
MTSARSSDRSSRSAGPKLGGTLSSLTTTLTKGSSAAGPTTVPRVPPGTGGPPLPRETVLVTCTRAPTSRPPARYSRISFTTQFSRFLLPSSRWLNETVTRCWESELLGPITEPRTPSRTTIAPPTLRSRVAMTALPRRKFPAMAVSTSSGSQAISSTASSPLRAKRTRSRRCGGCSSRAGPTMMPGIPGATERPLEASNGLAARTRVPTWCPPTRACLNSSGRQFSRLSLRSSRCSNCTQMRPEELAGPTTQPRPACRTTTLPRTRKSLTETTVSPH